MAVRRARAKPKARKTIRARVRTKTRANASAKGGAGGAVCIRIPRSGVRAICRTGPRIIIISGNDCV